jgi:hypothetical protein
MLGGLQPWFSGWSSPSSIDQFRKDRDELFDCSFGEAGHRGPGETRCLFGRR